MLTKENKQSANDLIPGYLKGELTDNEIRELITWIKLDPSNKRNFDEYCEIWLIAKASFRNHGYNFHEGFWKFKQTIKSKEDLKVRVNETNSFKKIIRYAAIFILAFTLSGLLFYYTVKNQNANTKQSISELIVPLGSRAQFNLSDGTSVTLNSGSRLICDSRFGINDRLVQLEGEGFFKVAKDEDKPFIVKTSHLIIRALGTTFDVKAYKDDKTIETTLLEGSVKIEDITEQRKPGETVLEPNQKLTFFKEDSRMTGERVNKKLNVTQPQNHQKSIELHRLVTENVNVEPVVSWKENRWIFEKQSLEQIAVDLERKFDIQIVFDSERLKSFRFTGIIMAEPIEQVLEVISLSAPINFKLKGRVITLSENKHFEELNKNLYNQK